MQEILRMLKEHQPDLERRFGVQGLWVFGSYARDEQRKDSDIDILVEFNNDDMTLFKFVELEEELSKIVGHEVDLVQRSALKKRMQPQVFAEAIAV